MKDRDLTTAELDVGIRRVVLKTVSQQEKENCLQKSCLDSDLALEHKLPIGLQFNSRKFKILIAFLVLYHYYPIDRTVFCYYHLDLLDLIESTESFWLSVLLKDKELFLKYLVEQRVMTEQQFYSGIVNVKNLRKSIEFIKFRFEEKLKHPRRVVRRKGYRDKGSLGSVSSSALKAELKNDYYLTLYQFQLEEREFLRSEMSTALREYLSEGRVLTDEQKIEFKLIPQKGNLQNESEGNFNVKDYCERRASEENLREEKKARRERELYIRENRETALHAKVYRIERNE